MAVEDSSAIIKKKEFEAFIKAIDTAQVGHWVEIARALNVTDDTIVAWKKLPEAQEAIEAAIVKSLKGMEEAGAKDWKMYEAKLKMLGINPVSKHEVKVDDKRKDILDKYGLDDARQTEETES